LFLAIPRSILRADLDIIDAHAHDFPDALANRGVNAIAGSCVWHDIKNHHDGTVRGLLASMDRAGIRRAVLCPVATKPTQVEKITDWSASLASERIIPFGSIHPDYPEPEREVERIAGLGMRGLKFHPQYMDCPLDDPRCLRIARAAASARLPVAIHGGFHPAFDQRDLGSPRLIRGLHEAIPELRIIACHMGGMGDWPAVVDYLVGTDMYLETSSAPVWCPPEVWGAILAGHSPERIVFGTDSPWMDQAAELASFMRLPLSSERFEMALSKNMAALLNV
jgi:predicted TIM-barrel fold metal-dependent hydrolase